MPWTLSCPWHLLIVHSKVLWSCDFVSSSRNNVPHATYILPNNITRCFVFLIIVKRPAVVCYLDGAIRAIGGAELGGIHTFARSRSVGGKQWRPGSSTFIVTVGCIGCVFCEEIQGHTFIIDQERAECIVLPEIDIRSIGRRRRLSSNFRSDSCFNLFTSSRNNIPNSTYILSDNITGSLVFL